MKRTKRIKLRNGYTRDRHGFAKISRLYFSFGYYRKRPHIANPYIQKEIGHYEGVRFIVSPTI